MIDNRLEYQRMYDVERRLWWYQSLHGRVLRQIRRQFGPNNRSIRILDAACGTGGLLSYLREQGYPHLTGFDYSRHAIDFSQERGLDVSFGDLRRVDDFRPSEHYDVITCNDALYFLTDEEITNALTSIRKRLLPGGLLLVNIHAFEAFAGTHDVAVGSSRRFQHADFERYAGQAGLTIQRHTYWPFALSVPILAVRQWQQYQLRQGRVNIQEVDSDVSYPGDLINGLLRGIMKLEETALSSAPFGSSLFLVMK
ncbi:class I SAM-dependent methyltransferase [Telluribacter humicola]|uniref:class I SAM-dependent methyltransferase n=1 Tax=Telluribacter humicola TaxID=1720261 RepID=UPI001A96CD77|nr:class I SAM-dependent methyltransferase [Telluribacter humicola]